MAATATVAGPSRGSCRPGAWRAAGEVLSVIEQALRAHYSKPL